MTIESNRTTGGVAASMFALGILSSAVSLIHYALPNSTASNLAFTSISAIFGLIGVVAFILFLVAMYGFSRDYGEHGIFSNIIFGVVAVIVVGVIAVIVTVFVVLANLGSIIPSVTSSPASSSSVTTSVLNSLMLVLPIFAVAGLVWILFNVRALNLLADKSKVPLFRTAALVLLAGAVLSVAVSVAFALIGSSASLSYSALAIVFAPGSLVQNIAWVLLAVAYFRIKPTATAPFTSVNAPPIQAAPMVSGQAKQCPNCGAQNPVDATYCTRCGQKL